MPAWKAPLLNQKARYLDNVAFPDEFANQIAISRDNSMLAIPFGIFKDPNGLAFFGLYSLSDGHRLSTIPGDAYKCGILHGALLNDELKCHTAPVGAVQFGPDSRLLLVTSLHLRQLQVSPLP